MSIDWPASLVTIRYKAFYQCDALVTLDLPEGLVRIEYRAFYGCENLASVNFPSTLEYIGDSSVLRRHGPRVRRLSESG